MLTRLEQLENELCAGIREAPDLKTLNDLRVRALGRKGEITSLLKDIKNLNPEERIQTGRMANEIKGKIEQLLEEKKCMLEQQELERSLLKEKIDITLPGIPFHRGRMHPLTKITEEIKDIFLAMSFSIAEGPEIEWDYYNFEALNVPRDHPARDMQDTLYITDDILLRTHTSPVQVRTLEMVAPRVPVKIIVPGRVYRRDDDATHSPMFHQIEGLLVDRHINFGHLKSVLLHFARQVFGDEVQVRYRPSFFPFTEPSAEMDISCVNCQGGGCRVCSQTGWLEILGAGMVHPRVLQYGGYNPQEVNGFAFGMGIERIAMLKYGINDLRLFFDNDRRFLAQI